MAKSGQTVVADSAGAVRVKTLVDGHWHFAVVNDVLFVPGLQCNLFSVRRLEDNGMAIKIERCKVSIEKHGRVVCCGHRKGQLYELDIFLQSETARAMMSQNVLVDEDQDDVWEDAVEFLEETVPAALEMESVAEKVNEIVAYVLTARILDDESEVRLSTPKRGSSYR